MHHRYQTLLENSTVHQKKTLCWKGWPVFDPSKIVRRTAEGRAIPHGNHYHFIPYSKLLLPRRNTEHSCCWSEDLSFKAAASTPSQPNQLANPSQPAKPADKDEHDHGFHAEHVTSKMRKDTLSNTARPCTLFLQSYLTKEQIAAAEATWLSTKIQASLVKSAQNMTVFLVTPVTKRRTAYISKTYGVPREAIKIFKGFFVFNNPDQDYDPTHNPTTLFEKSTFDSFRNWKSRAGLP